MVRHERKYGIPPAVKQGQNLVVDEMFHVPPSVLERMLQITENKYGMDSTTQVYYLPSVEYDLLAKGLLREDLKQWELSDKTRKIMRETLQARYLLRADIIELFIDNPPYALVQFVLHDLENPDFDYCFEVSASKLYFPIFGNSTAGILATDVLASSSAYSPVLLAYRRGMKLIVK